MRDSSAKSAEHMERVEAEMAGYFEALDAYRRFLGDKQREYDPQKAARLERMADNPDAPEWQRAADGGAA